MRTCLTLRVICIAIATCVSATSVQSAEWGDLRGRFVYDGVPPTPSTINTNLNNVVLHDEGLLVNVGGGIANIVIYVRTMGVEIHPELAKTVPPKVLLEMKGNRLVPHVVSVWFNQQTLLMKNADVVGYNLNLQPLGDFGINPLLRPGDEYNHAFTRKQTTPVQVACNIHPWITGYVAVRDNPYAAVSAKDGTFKIEKLPAGTELEFQVWQEKIGFLGPVAKEGQPPMTGTMKIEKDGKSTPADWALGRFKLTLKPGENDLGTIKVAPKLLERRVGR